MENNRLPLDRLAHHSNSEPDKPNPVAQTRFSDESLAEIKRGVASRIKDVFNTENNAEIARRCLTTNSTIKSYTDGERLPIAEMLIQMNRATGVSLDWLVLGKGRKFTIDKVSEIFSDEDITRIGNVAERSGKTIEQTIKALAIAQLAALDELNF